MATGVDGSRLLCEVTWCFGRAPSTTATLDTLTSTHSLSEVSMHLPSMHPSALHAVTVLPATHMSSTWPRAHGKWQKKKATSVVDTWPHQYERRTPSSVPSPPSSPLCNRNKLPHSITSDESPEAGISKIRGKAKRDIYYTSVFLLSPPLPLPQSTGTPQARPPGQTSRQGLASICLPVPFVCVG